MKIEVLTTANLPTNMTVETETILHGAFVICRLTCSDSNSEILIHDDEIDNLIAALTEIKKELR